MIDAIRRDVFDHIQRLHMRYFDRTKQGRIIARADRDVDTLEQLIFWGPIFFTMLVAEPGAGHSSWLFASNAALAALARASAMPLVWLTTRVFHRFGFPAYRRIRETHSAISAQVAEAITGVRVVQAFGQERRELDELEERQGLYRAAVLRGARIAAAYIPSLSLTFHGVLLVILVARRATPSSTAR